MISCDFLVASLLTIDQPVGEVGTNLIEADTFTYLQDTSVTNFDFKPCLFCEVSEHNDSLTIDRPVRLDQPT